MAGAVEVRQVVAKWDGRDAVTGLKLLGRQGDKSTAAVTKIGKAAQRAGASIHSGLGRMGVQSLARLKFAAVAAGAAFVAIGVAAAKSGIQIAAQRDAQIRGLGVIMGGLDKARAHFKELLQAALLPGVSLAAALEMSNLLQAAGQSSSLATRAIREFGNALALAGRSADELPGIALALTQISQSPMPMQQDIYQIINRLPTFGALLKEAFGSARAEDIRKQVTSGADMMEKLLVIMERGPRATNTFANALNNIGQTIGNLKAAFGEGFMGENEEATKSTQRLDEALQTMAPHVRELGTAVSEILSPAIQQLTADFNDAGTSGVLMGGLETELKIWAQSVADYIELSVRGQTELYGAMSRGDAEMTRHIEVLRALGLEYRGWQEQAFRLRSQLIEGKITTEQFKAQVDSLVESMQDLVEQHNKATNAAAGTAAAAQKAAAAAEAQAKASSAAAAALAAEARAYDILTGKITSYSEALRDSVQQHIAMQRQIAAAAKSEASRRMFGVAPRQAATPQRRLIFYPGLPQAVVSRGSGARRSTSRSSASSLYGRDFDAEREAVDAQEASAVAAAKARSERALADYDARIAKQEELVDAYAAAAKAKVADSEAALERETEVLRQMKKLRASERERLKALEEQVKQSAESASKARKGAIKQAEEAASHRRKVAQRRVELYALDQQALGARWRADSAKWLAHGATAQRPGMAQWEIDAAEARQTTIAEPWTSDLLRRGRAAWQASPQIALGKRIADAQSEVRTLTAEEYAARYKRTQEELAELRKMLAIARDPAHVQALRDEVAVLTALEGYMQATAEQAKRLIPSRAKSIFFRGGAAGGAGARMSQDALVSQVIGNLGAGSDALLAQASMDAKFREEDRLKSAIVASGETAGDRIARVIRDELGEAVARGVARALDAELEGAR